MVKEQVDKRQKAADAFSEYLSEDGTFNLHGWEREISHPLKDLAVKYYELSPCVLDADMEHSMDWHNYFLMGFKKFVRDLPSTTADLEKALEALNREEVAADARALEINNQIQPGPPTGTDKAPDAPAPHQNSNQNANGKRQAESQAEDNVTADTEVEAEVQDPPAKRVKHNEAENATTSSGFTVNTQGSLKIRISDDIGTTTFNLNGRSPAIVTVNVQKKDHTASASANGNKEATEEGAA